MKNQLLKHIPLELQSFNSCFDNLLNQYNYDDTNKFTAKFIVREEVI